MTTIITSRKYTYTAICSASSVLSKYCSTGIETRRRIHAAPKILISIRNDRKMMKSETKSALTGDMMLKSINISKITSTNVVLFFNFGIRIFFGSFISFVV
jgi:hypothetical protein